MARPSLLDKRIAYQFRSGALREQALTHRSFGSPHNERLEFLGDAVLNCVVAEDLYGRFPEMSEGQLSRLRANLVRRDSLSELAQALKISEFLRICHVQRELAGYGGWQHIASIREALATGVIPFLPVARADRTRRFSSRTRGIALLAVRTL